MKLRLIIILLLMLLLAGCAGEALPSTEPTAPVSSAPTAAPTATPTPTAAPSVEPSEEPSDEPSASPQDDNWRPPYEDVWFDHANYNVADVEETCGHEMAERVIELWYNVNKIWEYGCPLPLEYDVHCEEDYSELDFPHPELNMYYRLTNFDMVADRYFTDYAKERMREQSGTFLRTEDGYTWKMGCFKSGYTIAYEILDCRVQHAGSDYMWLNVLIDSTWCYKDWGDDPESYEPDLCWLKMSLKKYKSDGQWRVDVYDYIDSYVPMEARYYWYPELANIAVCDSEGNDISEQVQELWCMANAVYETEIADAFVSDEYDHIERPTGLELPRYYRRLLDFDRVTDGIFTARGKQQLFDALFGDLPWFIRTDDGAVYGVIAQSLDYSGPGTVEGCVVKECTPDRIVLDVKCNQEWRVYEDIEGAEPMYYLHQFVITRDEYGLWKVDDYIYDDTTQGYAARRPVEG